MLQHCLVKLFVRILSAEAAHTTLDITAILSYVIHRLCLMA